MILLLPDGIQTIIELAGRTAMPQIFNNRLGRSWTVYPSINNVAFSGSQFHKSSARIAFHVQNLFSTSENMRSRDRDLTSPPSVRFTAEKTYSITHRSE